MTDRDWPFLTGTEENVSAIASRCRFPLPLRRRHQPVRARRRHLRADAGRSHLARALRHSVPPRDLRLALVEASQGDRQPSRPPPPCFVTTTTRRPVAAVDPDGRMRIGGVLTVVVLGMYLLSAWRRERRASVSG